MASGTSCWPRSAPAPRALGRSKLRPAQGAAALEPKAIIAALIESSLDVARAVPVTRLNLAVDLARSVSRDGWLFPATPLAGRVVEVVFIGEGRISLVPPDATEAGQLELFTGETRLDRPFDAAVFVVASDTASAALFRRVATSAPGAAEIERATRALGSMEEER